MKHYGEKSFMQQYPLSDKKPLKKTIGWFFSRRFLSIVLIFVFLFFSLARKFYITKSLSFINLFIVLIGIAVVLFFAFSFILYLYEKWYYRAYFYNLTDDLIIIRKGPIAPHEVSIPYYRVQDVYVDQDILDKMFGLYDVHISTATAQSGVRAHIDGLEKQTAENLREFILKKIERSA